MVDRYQALPPLARFQHGRRKARIEHLEILCQRLGDVDEPRESVRVGEDAVPQFRDDAPAAKIVAQVFAQRRENVLVENGNITLTR